MNSIQIRNQFRVVMFAMSVMFVAMTLSTPAAAQSAPGEPCRVCGEAIPKPKPRPVICIPFRFPGLKNVFWCPGVGLVRGN